MTAIGNGGVSIIMATFNGARYVDDQLQSILAQATPSDEVIIADDCSTDGTYAILVDYAQRYPTIKVVRNRRNAGVRTTFETLLSLCTREVVFLSDQDDIWTEGRKDRMLDALRHCGYVAVLANAFVMTERGIEGSFFSDARNPNVRSIGSNFFRNNFIGCCMAFRREVLEIALPFPASISMHDWWIGTCAMALGEVRYLAAPSLLYRRHSANQSSGTRRRWSVVLKDRGGNLLALAALLRRVMRWHRVKG